MGAREIDMLTRTTGHTTLVPRLLIAVAIGVLFTPATARAQSEEVVYYHTDAIGSVRAITDATGAVIERYDFLPFGEALPSTVPETRQFAGKERDAETGLDYFGARHHMSGIGRFTSVDPVMNVEAALTDPQRWNRFSYARSNPFVFIDPDGRDITTPLTFQQTAFAQQMGANLQAAGKVLINMFQSLNLPGGDITPDAAAGHFLQPDSPEEAKRMQFLGAVITASPLLSRLGQSPNTMTAHGRERIAGLGATRGGTLSTAEITAVRQGYQAAYTSKANGARALVERTADGRFNVVIEGRGGYMTSYKTVTQKDLNRFAKKYHWDGYEHR
jgi:RHS repeat-associated protein